MLKNVVQCRKASSPGRCPLTGAALGSPVWFSRFSSGILAAQDDFLAVGTSAVMFMLEACHLQSMSRLSVDPTWNDFKIK